MIGLCLLTGCVVTTTSYLAKPNDQNNLFLANFEALAKDETSNNGKTCYYINVQSSAPHVYYLAVHANMNTGMDYQPPSAQML